MNIKLGMKFKSIEGISKGKTFTVTKITDTQVTYRSEETGELYVNDRKHFEKYIQRVNKFWTQTTKEYKYKKSKLKDK